MQKAVLERFISKYNLGGTAESVMWTAEKDALGVRCISDDKNVLASVIAKESLLDVGEYPVYDTAFLRSLMSVLDEDIQVTVNRKDKKALSLGLRDANTKVVFVLAKPEVIPAVPDVKALPSFDLEIALDERFFNTFVKGKNAMPDVETFTVVTEEGKTSIILGYSVKANTTRMSFKVELSAGEGLDRPINFSARYMKEILLANKEAKKGILKISAKGLAFVTFEVDGFEVSYYLVEIQTKS
jgi:hypothetical protein